MGIGCVARISGMPKSVAPALDGANGPEAAMSLDGNEGGG